MRPARSGPAVLKRLAIVLSMAALAPAALAQPVERIMSRDGILYVSGGVGKASEERLKTLEPQFNLKLVMTLTTGHYLADVSVVLRDAAGKLLLQHVTDGPIFMAKVPPGTYQVSTTYQGRSQSRTIKATGTLRTEFFRWSGETGIDAQAPPAARFVSGGIGEDEIAELRAKEHQYNLKLVFTLIEGNYVANVNVVLKNEAGALVVEHVAGGPIFMARLPAGTYSTTATYQGKAQTRAIKVGEKLRTEYFRWPADPQTDLPVSRWREPESGGRPRPSR
jgi:hypothetical protein